MLKINYPEEGTQELIDFLEDYKKVFSSRTPRMQRELSAILNLPDFANVTVKEVNDILTLDFEGLIKLNKSFLRSITSPEQLEAVQSIFKYDGKGSSDAQKKIAKFFVKYQELLSINTCYFCNLEYINPFVDVADYFDAKDLLQTAPPEDLAKVYSITENDARTIRRIRGVREGFSFFKEVRRTLGKTKFKNLKEMNFNNSKYYFTLDHVLDKGRNPLSALSLFNLVPSCYSCNSKFKGKKRLVTTIKDAKLSPTCNKFDFHSKNKFIVGFSSPSVNQSLIKNIGDFTLKLDAANKSKGYGKYEQVFKLNARYKEHKDDVLELIDKKERYPKSHIRTIAKITKTSYNEVKKNIFGNELDLPSSELNKKPKAKLKVDVAKQLKI